MTSSPASVQFRTSRAKALPLVIFMPVFLFLFGLGTVAFLVAMVMEGPKSQDWAGLLMGLPFFLFLWAEIRLVKRVIWPDTLTLTCEGWAMTRFGKPSRYVWRDYGEATKKYVSSGKSGSYYVRLEPKDGGKPVLIPGNTYIQSFDTVLDAVQQALAGRLVDPGPETAPKLYAYGIVPISIAATSLVFGTVATYAWRIAHLS